MTETLPELLCNDAWWQRVAPALSADGRALVKETLTKAAATLGEEERKKFATALSALHAPNEQQRAWLRDVAAVQTLPASEKILNLSNILICHPDTGAPIDLEDCQFPTVTFNGSVFVGKASFLRADFAGMVNFEGATFAGEADFEAVGFMGEANFVGASFANKASFLRADFAGMVNFEGATFAGEAGFWYVTFRGEVNFLCPKFAGQAKFWGVTFTGEANFWGATFMGRADFRQATFTGAADFKRATFTGQTNFKHTEFLGMTSFGEANFKQVATFHAARFGKTVSFRESEWGAVPDFIGTAWKDGVAVDDFHQLQTGLITGKIDLRQQSTSDPASRLQALRKMARDADDRPRELDYFALELQARYQGKELRARLKRCLVGLYGGLSNYGRGVGRPLRGLVELCLLSMLCYWVLADRGWRVWDNALLLSLLNALPPLGAGGTARESSLKALYGSDIPTLVGFIAVGEGIVGLILLFLIALGLRNRFRL